MTSFPALPPDSPLERKGLQIGTNPELFPRQEDDVLQAQLAKLHRDLLGLIPSGRVLKFEYRANGAGEFALVAEIPKSPPGHEQAIALIEQAGFRVENLPSREHSANRRLKVTGDLQPVHRLLGSSPPGHELAHS